MRYLRLPLLLLLVCPVRSALPQAAAPAVSAFKAGDRLEVYDPIEKNWFKAAILRVENTRYFIHYDGYDSKWDTWVDAARMRPIGSKKSAPNFYLVGTTESTYSYYVADQLTPTAFSADSIAFVSANDAYAFFRTPGSPYLTGTRKVYESKTYALWLDENSFLLSRSSNNISYYHRDAAVGKSLVSTPAVTREVDSLRARIRRVESQVAEAEQSAAKQRQIASLTQYIRGFQSRRTDPELVRAITKWWNGEGKVVNPLLRVAFCGADYAIVRNEFGIVLSKQVCTLLVWKTGDDGKCHMQWRNFGYESLGSGVFDTQLKEWRPRNISYNIQREQLDPGVGYELECGAVAP